MIDREKVIRGLEYCITHYNCRNLRAPDCPYFDLCKPIQNAKGNTLMRDTLSLLKAQEAKWIHREDLDFKDKLGCNHFHGMCENCGFIHDFIDDHTGQYKYCPQCGQAVKWND